MDPISEAILRQAILGGVEGGIGSNPMGLPSRLTAGDLPSDNHPGGIGNDVRNFAAVANNPMLTPPGPTYGGGSSMIKPAFVPGGGSQDTWMLYPNAGIGMD